MLKIQNEDKPMLNTLNLIGAITAHVIFISSIITFLARIFLKTQPGHWLGTPLLLMVFPLVYLLIKAPAVQRPFLYYLQVSIMLIWLLLCFLLDYVFKVNFRETQWMVISYVIVYFAGLGGMIGISSLAGRGWTISAVILFFVAFVLAFVQRAITGF